MLIQKQNRGLPVKFKRTTTYYWQTYMWHVNLHATGGVKTVNTAIVFSIHILGFFKNFFQEAKSLLSSGQNVTLFIHGKNPVVKRGICLAGAEYRHKKHGPSHHDTPLCNLGRCFWSWSWDAFCQDFPPYSQRSAFFLSLSLSTAWNCNRQPT